MQLNTVSKATLAAVAGLAASASANSCKYGGSEMVLWGWVIIADGVPDIPGICGGLWDNMNHFADCTLSNTHCGENENGELRWEFYSPTGCGPGHVESAWWEATRNDFGDLQCERV